MRVYPLKAASAPSCFSLSRDFFYPPSMPLAIPSLIIGHCEPLLLNRRV